MVMENKFYAKSISDVMATLGVNDHGLDKNEAARRLGEYGINKLPESKPDSVFLIFIRQFQSPLIYILFAASAAVFLMGEVVDGSIILAVLIFNAIVGSIQEGRAQNTLLALKKFAETRATVLREGIEFIVSDQEIVPGDVIILQEGGKIPADARVIVSHNLKVDESALTGESEPVHKVSEPIENSDLPAAEQKNMVFKGTNIVAGNGRAVVATTGVNTVIGKIAKEIATIDTEIPLKTNICYLSKAIIIVVAVISASIFSYGIFLGHSFKIMFATVVSLSVSVIPEGLPIVMTLVLATGVWRMSKRNALVKKLQAVEALGQARIIAVDKTGTITKNELVVQQLYIDNKFFEVGGIGYEPKGDIKFEGKIIDPLNHQELLLAGKTAAFCANARAIYSEESKQWRVSGDPTEAALFVLGEKIGFNKDDLESEFPLVAEIPFDYKLKYHLTAHQNKKEKFLAVVGAPETILNISKKVWVNGKNKHLSDKEKNRLESIFLEMSGNGLRVLAFAISYEIPNILSPENIPPLVFGGFFGMKDALRPEVKEAMDRAKSAGIKIVMITGDHKATAESIAKEAGIFRPGEMILTGYDIDSLSKTELSEIIPRVSIFARVSPEHKLKIVNAYKSRGEIISMTGDGVNDAPSLVAADLGVAMGGIGTEVAKEAADIVLLDDNFGSIISAVEEGRSIYKTIKKVLLYLFSTSAGEVLTITGAMILGFPLPILPAQIIWLNFVTDGFLDVALAMEPREKNLLRGNFERPKKYLVDSLIVKRIFLMALVMAIGTLLLFGKYFETDISKALTISLTILAVFQWFNAWNCRSEDKSIFQMNPFSNKFLVGATAIVIILQLLAVYNPVLQKLLKTAPLTLSEWLIIIVISASIIVVEEIRKFFYRKKLSEQVL